MQLSIFLFHPSFSHPLVGTAGSVISYKIYFASLVIWPHWPKKTQLLSGPKTYEKYSASKAFRETNTPKHLLSLMENRSIQGATGFLIFHIQLCFKFFCWPHTTPSFKKKKSFVFLPQRMIINNKEHDFIKNGGDEYILLWKSKQKANTK